MARSTSTRSVGRPREFDDEAVLEAAMDAFWEKGYEATSLSDLCCCTGLHKGSLYQAFGDKHELFMKALQHYSDTEFRRVADVAFKAGSPLGSIRAAVKQICEDVGHEKGCMMINSMVELAPHDPEVRERLRGFAEQRTQIMTDLIAKAQETGEIRVKEKPEILARQLMVTLAGAAAIVKGFLTPEEATATVENLIDSWT